MSDPSVRDRNVGERRKEHSKVVREPLVVRVPLAVDRSATVVVEPVSPAQQHPVVRGEPEQVEEGPNVEEGFPSAPGQRLDLARGEGGRGDAVGVDRQDSTAEEAEVVRVGVGCEYEHGRADASSRRAHADSCSRFDLQDRGILVDLYARGANQVEQPGRELRGVDHRAGRNGEGPAVPLDIDALAELGLG